MALVVGSILVLANLAGCGSSRSAADLPTSTTAANGTLPVPVGFPSTFLAVATTPPVIRGDKLYSYSVYWLQVRSVSTGAVRRTILHSLGDVDAVVTRDGSIVVAIDYGCRSVIERIAPASSQATVLRTVTGSVHSIAVNPSGTELAYLTYPGSVPHTCYPQTQPASPQPVTASAGPAAFNPNVLAVVNLGSGAVRSTATDTPGHPFTDPSWSPDGTQISVGYMGDTQEVLVLSASAPSFATARRLVPRAGCGFLAPAWPTGGIVAAEGCGAHGAYLSPGDLVRLASDGAVTKSWALPTCIDGIETLVDSSLKHVLVQAHLGYGNGPPCGVPNPGTNSVVIATVTGQGLTITAHLPTDAEVQATSW